MLVRHGLRNSLVPLVTLLGLSLPALVGGSVILEQIFAWPGMGRLFFEGILDMRDYPLIMGLTMMFSALDPGGLAPRRPSLRRRGPQDPVQLMTLPSPILAFPPAPPPPAAASFARRGSAFAGIVSPWRASISWRRSPSLRSRLPSSRGHEADRLPLPRREIHFPFLAYYRPEWEPRVFIGKPSTSPIR